LTRISGLWRLGAFFEAQPPVDQHTRALVVDWVIALLDDVTPKDAVAITHPTLGTVYRAIVPGTDAQLTYRLLATGSPRLLDVRRL
jgi:hypothetical protein